MKFLKTTIADRPARKIGMRQGVRDLWVFRLVFRPRTPEDTIMRIVNGLSWIISVIPLLVGLVWILLWK
jgi:hypothetical protein